jgi:hypothetical protein
VRVTQIPVRKWGVSVASVGEHVQYAPSGHVMQDGGVPSWHTVAAVSESDMQRSGGGGSLPHRDVNRIPREGAAQDTGVVGTERPKGRGHRQREGRGRETEGEGEGETS